MNNKDIMMNYRDPKNIAIAVLVLLVLIFGATTFFKKDSLYKYKLEQLQKEYDREHAIRDSLDLEITRVQSELASLKVREKELADEVSRLESEVILAKEEANRSMKELNLTRTALSETRKKIQELRNQPPNREGNKLIESLKLKTQ
jgi:peptidoglycan hydrolase CwlO-like protein